MLELKEIQRRRKQLNLTQTELAKLAEISQSALAKIERASINPSYAIAKKIFSVLEELEHKGAVKASDIMKKNVIFIAANERVEKAIEIMRKHNISQLPVSQSGKVVGLLSEANLLEKIGEKNLGEKKVSELMAETPPLIPENTPVKAVSELLKYNNVVLISKKAKITGIIAKADLLKVVK